MKLLPPSAFDLGRRSRPAYKLAKVRGIITTVLD